MTSQAAASAAPPAKDEDTSDSVSEQKESPLSGGGKRHGFNGQKRITLTKAKLRLILRRFATHAYVALRILDERRDQGLDAKGFSQTPDVFEALDHPDWQQCADDAALMEKRLVTFKRDKIAPIDEKWLQHLVSRTAFEAAADYNSSTVDANNNWVGLPGCDLPPYL